MNDAWLNRMAAELRRRGVGEATAGQLVTEASWHLDDSGQPASVVLGPPERYAANLASSLVGYVGPATPAVGAVRLSARGVGKRYRRRWVLKDVDLTVRAGQAAAVVGANGSGKSTFLNICAGLISATEGEVFIDGQIGLCPQTGGTLDFLRPDEHFVLLGAGRGLTRAAARGSGHQLAANLQWDSRRGQQARQLSGGTRQKLNLALAALGDPEVLLLDEPYQGFDQGTYLDFWERVWHWRAEGKAVVVVTHLLEQLDRVDLVLDLTRDTEEQRQGGRRAR